MESQKKEVVHMDIMFTCVRVFHLLAVLNKDLISNDSPEVLFYTFAYIK